MVLPLFFLSGPFAQDCFQTPRSQQDPAAVPALSAAPHYPAIREEQNGSQKLGYLHCTDSATAQQPAAGREHGRKG